MIKIKTDSRDMFVKIHNRLRRCYPEVYSYENWMPILGDSILKLVGKFNTE